MEQFKLLIMQVLQWIKKTACRRKLWIPAGIILFIVEMMLLIYPGGWLETELSNYLTGEGSWALEATTEKSGYCQEFVPQYKDLKSFSILLVNDGMPLAEGKMLVAISDEENNVVLSKALSYDEITLGAFTDIEADLSLKTGHSYYLTVNLLPDINGNMPSIRVCSMEDYLPENKILTQDEPIEDVQLVTRYVYINAIAGDKIFKAFVLCLLTAFLVIFGLPEKDGIRKMAGVVIFIALPYILGRRLELLTIDRQFLLPFAMAWNLAIMYLIEVVVLLCTHSMRFATAFTSLLLTIIYSVNYYVNEFRGVPIKLNEITAAGTAAEVVGSYDLTPDSHLAMAWCIAVLFMVAGLAVGKQKHKEKSKIAIHCVSAVVGIAMLLAAGYQLLYTDLLEKSGFSNFHGFDQNMIYHFNGFLVATCIDIQNSRIEEPEGYSIEAVEAILQNTEVSERNTEELPHVILIMNESFSDLRVLGNLELSEDNLSFFNSISENTVRGYANASVLGGGTANSEFEVFTGCSMGLLPSSYYAYQQCMIKPVSSLVSNMEANGYTTYSMHTEDKKNWNRDRVYRYLDFDNSLWKEDFEGAETLHYGVTDGETYKKIQAVFENRQAGEKLFIFDLTVQNHGGYSAWEGEDSVKVLNAPGEEAETYLTLIKASDEDFKELIDYFEEQDEKVVICMFGDHQPKFADSSFYESIYKQTEGVSKAERVMNQYKTPFIIWANYDIPEQSGMDISLNYLGVLLMKTVGLEMSDYFSFLWEQMQEYPIITVKGYVDKEGKIYEWSSEENEFPEYRMLQYNYLFGDTVEWGF